MTNHPQERDPRAHSNGSGDGGGPQSPTDSSAGEELARLSPTLARLRAATDPDRAAGVGAPTPDELQRLGRRAVAAFAQAGDGAQAGGRAPRAQVGAATAQPRRSRWLAAAAAACVAGAVLLGVWLSLGAGGTGGGPGEAPPLAAEPARGLQVDGATETLNDDEVEGAFAAYLTDLDADLGAGAYTPAVYTPAERAVLEWAAEATGSAGDRAAWSEGADRADGELTDADLLAAVGAL